MFELKSKNENTNEFQFLLRASGYLEAAKLCVDHGDGRESLKTPILHLIAHALEVLMKHLHLVAGKSLQDVRLEFNHNLEKLWDHEINAPLQMQAEKYSRDAWEKAKTSGKYSPDSFSGDSYEMLVEYIRALSSLHSSKSGYALRYVVPKNQKVPIPLLLVGTFIPTTHEFLRRLRT